ncbi:chemotaxis protein CheX [Inediibacterium massiliense]|uniref:chemotaxis protein CheX n=1 Tax=Inediibacterium massiliense TaxID=1658111 RepID=UPI0006B62B20|nr:chemotaxis protein CheX [Inediibacterium massiliense]
MDVRWINPFIEAFLNVMPQVGFQEIKKNNVSVKSSSITSSGVMMNLGIVGDLKGNVIYNIDLEDAKNIASKMMMGAPVLELDDMAQSAISELSNMITANASINFSKMDISTNISIPTLMYGKDFEVKVNVEQFICVQMLVDQIPVDINIAVHE